MSRLKELRKENNLSQRELGKVIGVTRQAISLYERGDREPKLKILGKLADYFGVSVDYLRGIDPYKFYVYYSFCANRTFLVVAKSKKQADKMLSNELRFDPYYKLSGFGVTTYPIDGPMIEEI